MVHKPRVLLVEDFKFWSDHIKDMVGNLYDFVTVTRLDAAIETLKSDQDFAAIMLDLKLEDTPPVGEDDLFAFRSILKYRGNIPVIVASGGGIEPEEGPQHLFVSKEALQRPEKIREALDLAIRKKPTV